MALRVPILSQGELLIASIQEELSDSEILDLQARILDEVAAKKARNVIVDVSLLDVLDSFGTRTLSEIAAAVRLRGAQMVIVGIQPEVAMAMVLLGLSLEGVPTALNLDHGIELLKARP